jgi:hypothetical protein
MRFGDWIGEDARDQNLSVKLRKAGHHALGTADERALTR